MHDRQSAVYILTNPASTVLYTGVTNDLNVVRMSIERMSSMASPRATTFTSLFTKRSAVM